MFFLFTTRKARNWCKGTPELYHVSLSDDKRKIRAMDIKVFGSIHDCGAKTNYVANSHRFKLWDTYLKIGELVMQCWMSMISVTEQNVVFVTSKCYFVRTVGVTT
jgi:hypothetical protein